MKKECVDVYFEFHRKFGYYPEVPFNVILEDKDDSKKFFKIIKKSINSGIDETIKEYGTDPTYGTKPFEGIYID